MNQIRRISDKAFALETLCRHLGCFEVYGPRLEAAQGIISFKDKELYIETLYQEVLLNALTAIENLKSLGNSNPNIEAKWKNVLNNYTLGHDKAKKVFGY